MAAIGEDKSGFAVRGVRVENFLGIRSFDHMFKGRLAVISGPNASGKSSFAAALRGAAASDMDPLRLGERQAKRYGHRGSDKAGVAISLSNDDVPRTWKPTARKISGSVSYPQKPLVIGLSTPFELRTDKEINEFWDDVVTVKITAEQVKKICRDRLKSYPETVGRNISGFVDHYMESFPAGECNRDEIKSLHSKMKGARAMGMSGIGNSVPKNVKGSNIMQYVKFDLPAEYEASSPADVGEEIKKLQHDLDHKYKIVDGDDHKKYQEMKAKWDEANKQVEAQEKFLKENLDTYEVSIRQDDKRIGDLRKFVEGVIGNVEALRAQDAISDTPMNCPECGVELSYDPDTRTLMKPEKEKAIKESKRLELLDEWNRKKNEADEKIGKLIEIKKGKEHDISVVKANLEAARQQADVYKEMMNAKWDGGAPKPKGEGDTEITMADYRGKVDQLARLCTIRSELERKTHIQLLAYQVQALDMLLDIMDPRGVASLQRERGFRFIENALHKIELESGGLFNQVKIDNDGRILIGDSPYALASKSERVWANWMIQCAFAVLYSGKVPRQLLVVDEVDIFDDKQMVCFAKSVGYVLDKVKNSQVVACGTNMASRSASWYLDHIVDAVEIG